MISVSVVFFVWLNQNDSFSSATLVALNVKRSRFGMDAVSVWQLKSIKNDPGNLQNRFFVCNAFYCVYNII